MSLTHNGRPFDAKRFHESLVQGVVDSAKCELHERFASQREPHTGEFPTVRVLGDSLEDLRLRLEGSPALISHIRSKLHDDDEGKISFMAVARSGPPKAFLSYSFDDSALAGRIARALMANGIDTWWAEWEMKAGDSLRQRIDEGLSGCTHFIVLLTPGSMQKPWVKQEMDAGLVRRIGGQARFIALRSGLPSGELPPLLSGMLSPEIQEDFDKGIRDLINDIHEVSRKPSLGPAPAQTALPDTGYSKVATAIAKVFVEGSKHGNHHDPHIAIEELMEAVDASREDVVDALYELRDFLQERFDRIYPAPELFAEFDGHFMEWQPDKDALRLAADMNNDENFPASPADIAAIYGWEPRRLNAAIAYLETRKVIKVRDTMGTLPYNTSGIFSTDATRRYVKSRT